jgi:hypothetical protein
VNGNSDVSASSHSLLQTYLAPGKYSDVEVRVSVKAGRRVVHNLPSELLMKIPFGTAMEYEPSPLLESFRGDVLEPMSKL